MYFTSWDPGNVSTHDTTSVFLLTVRALSDCCPTVVNVNLSLSKNKLLKDKNKKLSSLNFSPSSTTSIDMEICFWEAFA